jgi:outer membrane protein
MNTLRMLKSLVIAAVLAGAAVMAHAQDLKIGYVNLERVLRESAPAKAAQAKLAAEFAKREKDLDDMAGQMKAASDKLEKDSPTISEGERARRQRELSDQAHEFDRKRRELQEDAAQRKNEEVTAIVERANRIVKQIFDNEKYDLIVQDVVFASPKVDITNKVIDALNAGK